MSEFRAATKSTKKAVVSQDGPDGNKNSKTRNAILEAAVHHFAAFGYEGAHLRKMLAGIGQHLSLAHYYFGSKEALYEAAVRHYSGGVLAARQAGLTAWRCSAGRPEERLRDLFQAYVEPHMHVAMGPGGHDYARLMQRALGDPSPYLEGFQKDVLAVRNEFMTALQHLAPAADAGLLTRGMAALVSIMLAESIERSSHAGRRKGESAASASRFVAQFSAGGLLHLIGQGGLPKETGADTRD